MKIQCTWKKCYNRKKRIHTLNSIENLNRSQIKGKQKNKQEITLTHAYERKEQHSHYLK